MLESQKKIRDLLAVIKKKVIYCVAPDMLILYS